MTILVIADNDGLTESLSIVEVIDPPARAAGVKLDNVDALIDVLRNKLKVL